MKLSREQWYQQEVVRSRGRATCVMHKNPDGSKVLLPFWVDDNGNDFDVLNELEEVVSNYDMRLIQIKERKHCVTPEVYYLLTEQDVYLHRSEQKLNSYNRLKKTAIAGLCIGGVALFWFTLSQLLK